MIGIYRFFKTTSRGASVLAAMALTVMLFKVLVLNRIPEPFLSASELGVVFEGVLASIIASYIFYLFVIHLQEAQDRATLRPYIDKHARSVYGSCQATLHDISTAVGASLDLDTVTEADIQSAFSQMAPSSNAPLVLNQAGAPANWLQYFEYQMSRGKQGIDRVLAQVRFLSPALVSRILEIDDSTHYNFVSATRGLVTSNPNLIVWADPFYRFCVSCRALKHHLDTSF